MLMVPEFGFNKWGGGLQNLPQAWWFTRRTHLTQKSCWYSWFLFITMERHVLKSPKGKGKAHGAESRRNQGPASRCPLPVQHHWCARNLLRDGSMWEVLPASEVPWSLGVQGLGCKGLDTVLLWGRTSQGVRAHLPELAKDQSRRQAFLEDVRGLSSLDLLSEPFPAHQVSGWE